MLTAAAVQYLHSMLPCLERGSQKAEAPSHMARLPSKYTGFAAMVDEQVPAIGSRGSPPIWTFMKTFRLP